MITSLAIFEPGHLRLAMAFLDAGVCTRPLLKCFLSGAWLHGPLPDRNGLESYVGVLDQLRGDRELVEEVVGFASEFGRAPASPDDLAERFALPA